MRLGNIKIRNSVFAVAILLMSLQWGCSPEARHKTLVFFFDGVEMEEGERPVVDPCEPVAVFPTDAEVTPGETVGTVVSQPPTNLSQHPPYVDRACGECHQRKAANATSAFGGALCFDCHDASAFEFDYMHGPAAVGACTQCHHPHVGKFEFLLNDPVIDVCLSCHDRADVQQNENHDMETVCTECHNPHGGSDPFFF